MRPIVSIGSTGDPKTLLRMDVAWWRQATPEARLRGVEEARAEWLKLSAVAFRERTSGVNRDYEDLFAALNSHGARYLVVGGYAVAFYAGPRFTKDIDILIEPEPENAARVIAALTEFVGDPGITPERLSRPEVILMIGIPPTRVDVLTSIPGVDFATGWERRTAGHYGSQPVDFLGFEDLIRAKRAAGRPQDLIDAERLAAVAEPTLENDR